MITATSIDAKGVKADKVKLPEAIFGVEADEKIKVLAVRVFLANQRAGSARTKTRAEVSRTTAKMYKQKGTGRARHGAYSAPIFVGGGVALGPTGEQNFKRRMTKSQRRLALLGALSEKAQNGKITVLVGKSDINKTKAAKVVATKAADNKEKLLLVVAKQDLGLVKAFRNLDNVAVVHPEQLNVYLISNNQRMLITEAGLKRVAEIFKA
jgi:large subunit ribosomal protein L4